MYDGKRSNSGGQGGLFGDLFPVPSQQQGFRLAAINRDAPIKDAPVTLSNPFDFSQSPLGALQNAYLWNKLMFDPRLLATNPFFTSDSNLIPRPNWFDSRPMGPPESTPIVPPQFR